MLHYAGYGYAGQLEPTGISVAGKAVIWLQRFMLTWVRFRLPSGFLDITFSSQYHNDARCDE